MGRVSDAKVRLMQAVADLIWAESYGSTTIDHICEKAGVKKGSFYYFFDSKADVAAAAVDEEWQKHRPELDAIFSPTVPPLERLQKYCDYGYKIQADSLAKYGHVLGCPLCTLGSEISTQEDGLQRKVQEILNQKRKYLESAIRDAHAAGLVEAPDAIAKANILFTYYQGLAMEARIQNKLDLLKDAMRGTYDLLGAKIPAAVIA
jgi:TetR/AcrR family transcriptional repressor of nem operon